MPAVLRLWAPAVGRAGSDRYSDSRGGWLRRSPDTSTSSNTGLIVVASVVIVVVVVLVLLFTLRVIRRRNPGTKEIIPTSFLKRGWTGWNVAGSRARHAYQQTNHVNDGDEDDQSGRMQERRPLGNAEIGAGDRTARTTSNTAGQGTNGRVDRNTSVRSVATLPAYQPWAADTEQVLGREGERDGIDVVVELPTAEEEESLRDEEMEAMYRIRAARRRQLAEREQLWQERAAARRRHDTATLTAVRENIRAASAQSVTEIEELRREHERIKETRQRAVSSVSYADVGIARADGTRVRGNSTESERVGLLSDTASIAPSARSVSGTATILHHGRSASSMSVDTLQSINSEQHADALGIGSTRAGAPAPAPAPASGGGGGGSVISLGSVGGRIRADSSPNTRGAGTTRATSRSATSRAGSSPEMIDMEEGDVGESNMPPPGYDDVSLDELTPMHSRDSRGTPPGAHSPYSEPPPDYPGPAQARSNRLSAQMENLVAETAGGSEDGPLSRSSSGASRTSRRGNNIPPHRLPSLRLGRLPQIVIEPSSAAHPH